MHSANIPNGSKWSESNLSLQYACAAYISTTPPAFWPQLTVKCLKHLDTLKCFNWRSYIPGDSGGYCILYFENRLNLIKLYIKLPSALHGSFTDPSRILHGSCGAGLGCQHAEEPEGAPNTWAGLGPPLGLGTHCKPLQALQALHLEFRLLRLLRREQDKHDTA